MQRSGGKGWGQRPRLEFRMQVGKCQEIKLLRSTQTILESHTEKCSLCLQTKGEDHGGVGRNWRGEPERDYCPLAHRYVKGAQYQISLINWGMPIKTRDTVFTLQMDYEYYV